MRQRSVCPETQRRGTGCPRSLRAHPALPVPKRARNRPEIVGALRVGGAEVDLARGTVRAPDGTETELRRQSADRAAPARRAPRRDRRQGGDLRRGLGRHRRHRGQPGAVHRRHPPGARRRARHAAHGPARRATGSSPRAARSRRAAARVPPLAAGGGLAALHPGRRLDRLLARATARRPRSAASSGPVVAVLPFENLSGGERWDRLARGLTEEVIADLARNPWLFVLADATTADTPERRRRRSRRRSGPATSSPAPSRPRATGCASPPPCSTPTAAARSGPSAGRVPPTSCSRCSGRRPRRSPASARADLVRADRQGGACPGQGARNRRSYRL